LATVFARARIDDLGAQIDAAMIACYSGIVSGRSLRARMRPPSQRTTTRSGLLAAALR
jgi:hypothetical protein